jgi:hypothetical protein
VDVRRVVPETDTLRELGEQALLAELADAHVDADPGADLPRDRPLANGGGPASARCRL